MSSFHISIYCVTFVQILRSFLPFKQAVRWGQHDFCSLLSVKFAKTIFMQNYVGPIYLHIRKPIVCKIPPLSPLNNTKYSLDSWNISLIAAFLKKNLSLIMGKMLSTRNVQVSPSVDKKLGKRWLYYNY